MKQTEKRIDVGVYPSRKVTVSYTFLKVTVPFHLCTDVKVFCHFPQNRYTDIARGVEEKRTVNSLNPSHLHVLIESSILKKVTINYV